MFWLFKKTKSLREWLIWRSSDLHFWPTVDALSVCCGHQHISPTNTGTIGPVAECASGVHDTRSLSPQRASHEPQLRGFAFVIVAIGKI